VNDKYETASLVQIRENRHSTGLYDKRGLTIMRGEGAYVWDERAVRYIDCISGDGVANVGHSNPDVVAAIIEQTRSLLSCPEIFYNDKRAELLEKLSDLTPDFTTRFLLCNSESEAAVSAISMARTATRRRQIVACKGSDHGLILDLGSQRRSDFISVPYNDIEKIEQAVAKETAAVILELVQSNDGVHVAQPVFVNRISQICKERGVVLIIDESQTGFGRTGAMFALSHFGLQPDIIMMSNAIASGLPLGVVAITKAIGDKLTNQFRVSPFSGNPVSSAAACATIDYLKQFGLPERAKEMGTYLMSQIRAIGSPKIIDVRGMGLLIGVELSIDSEEVLQALAAQGVLVLTSGPKVVRLLPPLTIAKDDLDFVVEKIAAVLQG